MRFAVEDSRRFPQDHIWGIGIECSHFDGEYSLEVGFGYRAMTWSWGERPPPTLVERAFAAAWTWGLSVCHLPAEGWSVRLGPWLLV